MSFERGQIEQKLIHHGLQPTLHRVGLCQFLLRPGHHPTAEETHQWAAKHLGPVSLATVYNTLRSLTEVGLIQEVKVPHLNKTVYDNNMHPHHHFIDEQTGTMIDICPDQVHLSLNLPADVAVSGVQVFIHGHKTNNPLNKGE